MELAQDRVLISDFGIIDFNFCVLLERVVA
jgi:hypothetical protein